MARQKGTANFSGTLEVLAGGPIDSRTVVPTLADLTVASNFPYAYVGMETYVVSENKKYRLIAADVTQSSSWEEVGSGGGEIDVDDALSTTSENPVQNKVVKAALDSKVNAVNGKGLSTNDYTTSEKNKLAGLSNYDDTALRGLIAGKQDQLTAGNGIDITNNVISAGIPIVSNQFDKANIYSTTEKVVGCWTDGRPVYQKVIDFGVGPNANSKSVVHGIDNIATVVKMKIIGISGSGSSSGGSLVAFALDSATLNSSGQKTFTFLQADKITIRSDIDQSAKTFKVILQYTKITDAANSFKYADENDYSTTEHIVGSWIDGKPVYQKTVNCGKLPGNSTTRTNHGISNLGLVIWISGAVKDDNNVGGIVIPGYNQSGQNDNLRLAFNDTVIVITTNVDYPRHAYANNDVYVTIQYTKTTD